MVRLANIFTPPPPPPPPKIVSEKELAHKLWLADEGDKTLRQSYTLVPSDIVVDLGGFEGQWASDIFSRYLCTIHVVEPVKKYALGIAKRFQCNQKIHVHQIALGAKAGKIAISIAGDASSSFKVSETVDLSHVVPFDLWMDEHGIDSIALLKVNIEGGEYDLLEYLIEKNIAKKISNIQVQFHDFIQDSDCRMTRIKESLSKTHHLTYEYKYVWENWSLSKLC